MKFSWKRSTFIYIVVLVATIALFSFLLPTSDEPEEIPLSRAIAMSQNHEIESILVEGEAVNITTFGGTEYLTFKEISTSIFEIEGLNDKVQEDH